MLGDTSHHLHMLSIASLGYLAVQRYGWPSSFAIAAVFVPFSAACWVTVHPDRPLET